MKLVGSERRLMHLWSRSEVSLCWLESCCLSSSLLLLLVQDDTDDVSLVILHVLHQMFFACGLEATDAAAEQENAVFHTRSWNRSLALGLGEGWALPRHTVFWRVHDAREHTPWTVHRQTGGRHSGFCRGFRSVLWQLGHWRTLCHHVHGCRPLRSPGEDKLSHWKGTHWKGTMTVLNLISLSDSCTLLTRGFFFFLNHVQNRNHIFCLNPSLTGEQCHWHLLLLLLIYLGVFSTNLITIFYRL